MASHCTQFQTKNNYMNEITQPPRDILIGCLSTRWDQYKPIIMGAASLAGQHLGIDVAVEPLHLRNADHYDLFVFIGASPIEPINKCSLIVDTERLQALTDYEATEKLTAAIEEAICGISLQSLSA
jgi:hypothetical protein